MLHGWNQIMDNSGFGYEGVRPSLDDGLSKFICIID
jgi:hypothetical protein